MQYPENQIKSKFANNNTLSPQRRINQLRYDYKRFYGLTLEKVKQLKLNPCEICGVKAKRMIIDHVIDGTYRGILCQQCNTRLGWYEKRKNIINKYIKIKCQKENG